MRHCLFLFMVGSALVFMQCASTRSIERRQLLLSLIPSWQFEYSSRVDENATPSYQSQRTKVGQLKGELRFPDLVFTHLKNRYHLPVTKDDPQAEGRMFLQAVTFASGGFAFVDVVLVDKKSLVLARTRIWNVDEHNVVIHGDDFAEFAAEKIADLFESR